MKNDDMSLVEKAKLLAPKPAMPVKAGEMALALAWAAGEVTYSQVCRVLGYRHTQQAYTVLARGLRAAYQEGRLVVKEVSQ